MSEKEEEIRIAGVGIQGGKFVLYLHGLPPKSLLIDHEKVMVDNREVFPLIINRAVALDPEKFYGIEILLVRSQSKEHEYEIVIRGKELTMKQEAE